jgi:hypothetical protein
MDNIKLSTKPLQWIEIAFFLTAAYYGWSVLSIRILGPSAPLFGPKSIVEGRIITNYRFFKNSASIVNTGYNKVMDPSRSTESKTCLV